MSITAVREPASVEPRACLIREELESGCSNWGWDGGLNTLLLLRLVFWRETVEELASRMAIQTG